MPQKFLFHKKNNVTAVSILFVAAVMLCMVSNSHAQVFGFRGGIMGTDMKPYEKHTVKPMLNYHYELYYHHRLRPSIYMGTGLTYLGYGSTIEGYFQASDSYYRIKMRYSHFGIPLTLKYSRDGHDLRMSKNKLRPYLFISAIPTLMFDDDKKYTILTNKTEEKHQEDVIEKWTPNRINIFAMIGTGVFYKHFTFDVALSIAGNRTYQEDDAPVPHFRGAIVTIGYQVSRSKSKMW